MWSIDGNIQPAEFLDVNIKNKATLSVFFFFRGFYLVYVKVFVYAFKCASALKVIFGWIVSSVKQVIEMFASFRLHVVVQKSEQDKMVLYISKCYFKTFVFCI